MNNTEDRGRYCSKGDDDGGKDMLDTDMQWVVVVGDTVRSKMVMITRL